MVWKRTPPILTSATVCDVVKDPSVKLVPNLVSPGTDFALMLLFGALLQPLIGKFSDKIGRRPVVVTGNLIAMVAAVAIALASVPGFAITAMVVTATALVAIRSVVLASAVDYSGKREATTLGFTFAVMDGVGVGLTPAISGRFGLFDLNALNGTIGPELGLAISFIWANIHSN